LARMLRVDPARIWEAPRPAGARLARLVRSHSLPLATSDTVRN
jgi:hypothetical protein